MHLNPSFLRVVLSTWQARNLDLLRRRRAFHTFHLICRAYHPSLWGRRRTQCSHPRWMHTCSTRGRRLVTERLRSVQALEM